MSDVTFVCCIEYGALEDQTLMMLRSLRRHEDGLCQAPVVVVQPRRGPKLRPSTVAELHRLHATLVVEPRQSSIPWFAYANKVAAVQIAQKRARTSLVAWLDSDILVAAPPFELLLDEDVDFAARAEFLPPAVHPGDPTHVPYWRALCTLMQVDFDDVPSLYLDDRDEHIRMYFNSGVFVWRRASTFAQCYVECFRRLMESRLAQYDGTFFTADQVILTPVVVGGHLRWHHLGHRCHHMIFQSQLDGPGRSPNMQRSALIHYSKSLHTPFRERFLKRLQVELPAVHAFTVAELAGERHVRDVVKDFDARVLRKARGLRWRLYAWRVRKPARPG